MQGRGNAEALEHAVQQAAMIEPNHEVAEPQPAEHIAHRGEHFRFDHGRARPDGVDVTLIELAEPAPGRTVRPPHRLNLVALEEARQLAAVLGHHPRERNREVVAQRQVGFARRFMLTPAQHLEYELGALVAVLSRQGLDVLEGRRFERLEPVAPVHVLHDADDVVAAPDILGEKIAHAARGARLL